MDLVLHEYTDLRFRSGDPLTGTVTLRRDAWNGRVAFEAALSRADPSGYHRLALYRGTCERPEAQGAATRIFQTQSSGQFNFSFDELANQPYALIFYYENDVDVLNGRTPPFDPLRLNANYGCVDIPAAMLPFEETRAQMADPKFYEPYGAFVLSLGPGQGRALYLPLQLATDSTTGAQYAFQGRMVYHLRGDTWGAPHQVRLVWAVVGLSDRCSEGDCRANKTQILTVYPDEWQLTGLRVREDNGGDETERDAEGKQFAYQLYYLVLYKGVVQLVQLGDHIVSYTFTADTGIVAKIIKLSGTASSWLLSAATKIGNLFVSEVLPLANLKTNFSRAFERAGGIFGLLGNLKTVLKNAALASMRDLVRGIVDEIQAAWGALTAKLKALSLFKRGLLVVAVLAVVVMLVVIGAVFIASFIFAQLGGPG